jgi:hypothetical protein
VISAPAPNEDESLPEHGDPFALMGCATTNVIAAAFTKKQTCGLMALLN